LAACMLQVGTPYKNVPYKNVGPDFVETK
jgi:hypothetical protein